MWVILTGRLRPSARIGFPWLGALLAWILAARLAVDHPALRRPGALAWVLWLLVGGALQPVVVAFVSRLIDVPFRLHALRSAALATLAATAVALLLLLPDFRVFAVLGGFGTALVAATVYAFGTSRGLEAWRDGSGL